MQKLFTKLLLLFCLVHYGRSDSFFLSDDIKRDLFNIYTGAALVERGLMREPVKLENVKMFLYTKNNKEKDAYIPVDLTNPTPLHNPHAKIVFIIHGWLEHKDVPWYDDLKDAFLKRDSSYYVVQVDWSEYSHLGYLLSSYTTMDIGGIVGEFISDLHKNYGIPISNFLVVGHSLGGQISGYVGKKVQNLTNQKLPRIVALDPAGPLFSNRPEEERLNKDDAEVVHVIHTNGGTFGFLDKCGTLDFYPNGGSFQPGCLTSFIPDLDGFHDIIIACDHQRSWKYFTEAVANPEAFRARKCGSWIRFATKYLCDDEYAHMGDLETRQIGDFYLETNSDSPYNVDETSFTKRFFGEL